jgi:hypothetical protein
MTWKEIIKEVRDSEIGDMEQYERDMLRRERYGSQGLGNKGSNDLNLGQYTNAIDQAFMTIWHHLDSTISTDEDITVKELQKQIRGWLKTAESQLAKEYIETITQFTDYGKK